MSINKSNNNNNNNNINKINIRKIVGATPGGA